MTDEQIKQNAEVYAIENYGEYDEIPGSPAIEMEIIKKGGE